MIRIFRFVIVPHRHCVILIEQISATVPLGTHGVSEAIPIV